MANSQDLSSAKTGNPQSIAAVINKSIRSKGMFARAECVGSDLIITIESKLTPPELELCKFLKNGLIKLNPSNLKKVIIQGKTTNQEAIEWQHEFELINSEKPVSLINQETKKITNDSSSTYHSYRSQESSKTSGKKKKKVYAKPKKSFSDLTINEVIQVIIDFSKTRNGERALIIIGTFLVSSIYWNSFNTPSSVNQEVASSSSAPSLPFLNSSHTLNGSITLVDSDISGTNDYCYGTGGYSDIQANMPVTVKDGSGNILATGNTSSGSRPEGLVTRCVFEFELDKIPKVDFYSIEVGRRGELNYSFEEMKTQDWTVSFSIGT